MPTMDVEHNYCLTDDWKELNYGPTLQDQLCEERKITKQLTDALVNIAEEHLKLTQQLLVERQHFNLVVMETRKLRLEVLDWRTLVEILVAETKILVHQALFKDKDNKPILATKTPQTEDALSDGEGNDELKPEIPNAMPISDSSTVTVDNVADWLENYDAKTEIDTVAADADIGAEDIEAVEAISVPEGEFGTKEKKKKKPPAEDSFIISSEGYQCKICGRTVNAKSYLGAHLRRHEDAQIRYPCEICGRQFRETARLRSHVKHIHQKVPRKLIKCDLCERTFANRGNMRRHRHSHFDDRPHLCDICGKGFKVSGILKEHYESHRKKIEKKELKCRKCDLIFPDEATRVEHRKIHPRREFRGCEICGEKFASRVLMRNHLLEHPEVEMFQCEHCDTDFTSKKALAAHQELHSGKTYACGDCGKRFAKRSSYYFHKKWHHNKCEVCGEEFTLGPALQEHSYIHTGIPPFECPVCSIKFIDRRLFWKHKLTHDELKPYVCHCGSRFVNATHLSIHKKLHAKLGPIIVPRGDKTSTTFVRKNKFSAATSSSGKGKAKRVRPGAGLVEAIWEEEEIY